MKYQAVSFEDEVIDEDSICSCGERLDVDGMCPDCDWDDDEKFAAWEEERRADLWAVVVEKV